MPSGTFGNSGRNILRGPGLSNTDIAISRRFGFGGQTAFELRWEVFNVINHVNFNAPITALNSASFGQIQTAGDPRIMQFALKFTF